MSVSARVRRFRQLFHGLVMLVLFWTGMVAAAALSPQEERGKQIFVTGSSASGQDITAYVGQGATPVPASVLPCANCHGADGLGRPEGGVIPSNITWSELTKSYGTVSATGRRRPAYTTETLARSIAKGIDSAGNRLDPGMPRYRMSAGDLADLVAYLQRLETDLDPGLAEGHITLGTVVPKAGALRSLGQSIQAVLTAYFADLNAQGGIYGRQLDLEVREATTRDALLEKGKDLVEGGQVFALVGAFTAGMDEAYAELVEQHQVPLVGPFTQFPQDENALQRFTFYLYGGLPMQGRVLVDYARHKLDRQNVPSAVVHPAGPHWVSVAQAIDAQAGKQGWPQPLRVAYTPGRLAADQLAQRLQTAGVEALFFFGAMRELVALAREAERLTWTPHVFLSGSLASKDIFKLPLAFQGKIALAYATVPADHTRKGVQEFNVLQQRHALTRQHLPAQVAAYVAAKVLVEGLKRAGRNVSREKLIAVLEQMHAYDTGLTPQVTYGPNRHIGVRGAHIVAIDLATQQFAAGSEWIALE